MISWYFASSLPIFIQAYSAQTVLFLVTPRSTQSLSCDLFLVRGRIFFNPSQAMLASSIKINYYYYNEETTEAMFVVIPGAAETIEAFSLFWITVHPPKAVVWSQYASKGALLSR